MSGTGKKPASGAQSQNRSSSSRPKQETEGFVEFATVRRAMRASVAGKLFGFELDVLKPGRAVMSMRVRGRHLQLHGMVHGGLFAALADTAGALAAYPMLPRGTQLATISMTINYLEGVADGAIVADGRVVRLGKKIVVSECDIKDHNSRLVAKSLMTFAIRQPRETKHSSK